MSKRDEVTAEKITWFRYARHAGSEREVGPLDTHLPGHHGDYSFLQQIEDPMELDSDKRKEYPIHSGLIRYFPDALAEVAALSLHATKQHHPGKPMHWDRSKSGDELDALCRHLAEAGTLDTDKFYHDVKIAWRALANLQKLLERVKGLPVSPASKPCCRQVTAEESRVLHRAILASSEIIDEGGEPIPKPEREGDVNDFGLRYKMKSE